MAFIAPAGVPKAARQVVPTSDAVPMETHDLEDVLTEGLENATSIIFNICNISADIIGKTCTWRYTLKYYIRYERNLFPIFSH